jgi:hypothetical protein
LSLKRALEGFPAKLAQALNPESINNVPTILDALIWQLSDDQRRAIP